MEHGVRRASSSVERVFDFGFRKDNHGPNAYRQAYQAAGRNAGDHGDNTGRHRQAMVFKVFHLYSAQQNQTARENPNDTKDYRRTAGKYWRQPLGLSRGQRGKEHSKNY